MRSNISYIMVMAVVSLIIRALPMTVMRRQIRSRFLRSFLYYVPYVTLAVMTFPAIMQATNSPLAGIVALLAGIVIAWVGGNLFVTSISCCVIVFILELFL